MNPETREALIDAGVLRPGSLDDAHLTLLRVPPDRVVLRLDDAGRAAAARTIATDPGNGRREFRANWPWMNRRRSA